MNFPTLKKARVACYTLLFVFLVVFQIQPVKAQTSGREQVTIQAERKPVAQVFDELARQTGLKFFYSESVVDNSLTVNLNFTNARIQQVLDEIAKQAKLSFSREDNTISVSRSGTGTSGSASRQIRVSGIVTDRDGEPVIGANVIVKGTTTGSMTDINGAFTIDNVPSNATLHVSYLGLETQEVPVRGNANLNIRMEEDAVQLSEVVAIGYGTARKSDLTGALTSVTSEQFEEQKVTRVDQILQGRAAGVQITNTVGAPGGDVRIRIRGVNSVLGDNSPLFVIDGFVGADFNMLNPNDIQSIEILKDASSTAIYGSRGANGVVLVTTKGGTKSGKVTVNYQGDVSMSSIIKKYDMLSAGEFAETANARNAAFELDPVFNQQQIDDFYANGGFDYQDAIFRTAISTQHQIGIAGGTEKTQYRISGNYLNQQGIIENSSYERYTVRANFNTKFDDKLSFRFNINGSTMTGINNQARTGAGNPFVQALAWAPTTDPYDGQGGYTMSDPVGSIKINPLALVYDSEDRRERTFANLMGGLRYEIIDGLAIDFQAGADMSFRSDKFSRGIYVSNNLPEAGITDYRATNIQTTSQISYDKAFNDIHRINAVAAIETQKWSQTRVNANSKNLKFPDLGYDNLAQAESYSVGSGYEEWALLSYLARVNYSLKNRYLVSVSVRHDGSSKFAKGNRFSTFPSAAVAWNMANEEFIRGLDLFSKLKLRVSWGLTGSQAINPYATQSTYKTDIYYAYTTGDRTSGIQIGDPANKDLKWETTEQKDFGFEAGFFKGRLNFEFDYFIKDTRDLLLNQTVPFYTGGGNIVSNVGKIRNEGWEIAVSGTVINTRDVSWKSEFNFSRVKNTVKNLGEEKIIYSSPDLNGMNGQPEFVYAVGEPLGSFWGLNYLGTWKKGEEAEAAKYEQVPGDARYEDLNGDGVIDGEDYQIIGCGLPKGSLGWNNTVTYKNFTFNALFQGVFGIQKQNYTRAMHLLAARDARHATLAEIKDRYIAGVNEDAYLPGFSRSNNIQPQSTMFLENASYLRLKNLSVAYNFRIKNVGDLKVALSGTNLITFTKYKGVDPEASIVGGGGSDLNQSVDYGAYPNSRTYTLSLDFTF